MSFHDKYLVRIIKSENMHFSFTDIIYNNVGHPSTAHSFQTDPNPGCREACDIHSADFSVQVTTDLNAEAGGWVCPRAGAS